MYEYVQMVIMISSVSDGISMSSSVVASPQPSI